MAMAQKKEPIAIVGIGCRFPGDADTPEKFWKNLCEGKDCISEVPKDRWDIRKYYDPDPDKPGKMSTFKAAFLENIFEFDPLFFGISPREAESMDPQQRLILKTTWDAIENAGLNYTKAALDAIGVFIAGFHLDNYLLQLNSTNRSLISQHTPVNTMMTMLSSKISYLLNLQGPCITIDTACSSSLSALYIACSSLWDKKCSIAIVGGTSCMLSIDSMVALSKGRFLSGHGHSKAFSKDAAGYGRGEGAATVILKPLSDAINSSDNIYACIKHIGMNQDGRTAGITLPNKKAQAALINNVYKSSKVDIGEVKYIEAHGTGTVAGDAAEAWSINSVFEKFKSKENPIHVGSVKTNIGHTEAVSGIAGLIKAALVLKHRQIPPSLHADNLNPSIPFDSMCLKIPTELTPLPCPIDRPAYAGVNSFGYGGTNVHALLESAPVAKTREDLPVQIKTSSIKQYIVPFTARHPEALKQLAGKYATFLRQENPSPEDFCHTLIFRRSHHDLRSIVIAESTSDLIEKFEAFSSGQATPAVVSGHVMGDTPRILFVYTGMGPQWHAMGRELYDTQPVYRKALEECDLYFRQFSGWSIIEELQKDAQSSRIHETAVTQPALVAVQIALTKLWESRGITPDAVIGHSLGEVAAAWASGAIDLQTAMKLIFHRGRALQCLAGKGTMLAVGLAEKEAKKLIRPFGNSISIAAINDNSSVTLSGNESSLKEISDILQQKEVFNKLLKVEVPFHSPLTESILEDFKASIGAINPLKTAIPLFSTVAGKRINGKQLDADYWCKNIRQPVCFADSFTKTLSAGYNIFIEIGPHPVLRNSIGSNLSHADKKGEILPSLLRQKPENQRMLESLAALYTLGKDINWNAVSPAYGEFIKVPTYPWQTEIYWQESEESKEDRIGRPEAHPFLQKNLRLPKPAWESEANIYYFPYLSDHKIAGNIVFPAAGYIDAAMAVNNEINSNAIPLCLDSLSFKKMLILTDKKVYKLHLEFDQQTKQFSFYSKIVTNNNKENWTLHSQGRILSSHKNEIVKDIDIDVIKVRCPETISSDDIYRLFQNCGLEYGDSFKAIRNVYKNGDEALLQIKLKALPFEDNSILFPGILDAAFQGFICFSIKNNFENLRPLVPVSISRLLINTFLNTENEYYVYLKITSLTRNTIKGDAAIYSKQGRLIIDMSSIVLSAINETVIKKDSERLLYQIEKKEIEIKADGPKDSDEWLIMGHSKNNLQYLSNLLNTNQITFNELVLDNTISSEKLKQIILNQFKNNVLFPKYVAYISENGIFSDHSEGYDNDITGLCNIILSIANVLNSISYNFKFVVINHTNKDKVFSISNSSTISTLCKVINLEMANVFCTPFDGHGNRYNILLNLLFDSSEINVFIEQNSLFSKKLKTFSIPQNDAQSFISTTDSNIIINKHDTNLVEDISFKKAPLKNPKQNEIQIKVHYTALNFKDLLKIIGKMPEIETLATYNKDTIGIECFGVVVNAGDSMDKFKTGDHVIVAMDKWCMQAYITTNSPYIYKVPQNIDINFPPFITTFITAYYGIVKKANLSANEKILIHNGSGATGLAAIQIAKWLGAEIYATAGNEEKRKFLQSTGIKFVFDSRSLDFAENILQLTDDYGVDVIFSAQDDEILISNFILLSENGRYIEIGKKGIINNDFLPMRPFDRNISFFAIDIDRLAVSNEKVWNECALQVLECFEKGYFKPHPCTIFKASEIKDAFTYMAQSKHIGKIVIDMKDQIVPVVRQLKGDLLREDGTYIVTGGLSGFGLATAKWLAENGAGHLVLLSRRGLQTDEAKTGVEYMENLGTRVKALAADVTDRNGIDEVMNEIKADFPPVRGIIHAAMVLDDKLIRDMDYESLDRVMAPKVKGAINLHEATLKEPLDFFVCYSSVSAVIGNAGQANYAAANGFLDGFAKWRREQGLPCTSINWGAIGDTGVVARNKDVADMLAKGGIRQIPVKTALEALGKILLNDLTNIGVFDIDWEHWASMYPKAAKSEFFSEVMATQAGEQNNVKLAELAEELEEFKQSGGKPIEFGILRLKSEVSSVLKMPETKISADISLNNLGIDSLMGMELSSRLNKELGIELTSFEIIKGITLKQLAEKAVGQIEKVAVQRGT
ncbi:MAG: SDR family NAD(P)-dependent oxidoreductase [Chitinivibrionales bacterium]|nr:SDR family NAD(P)-dependent oxidoreductase [Chitinivibrionales bacterium]